jgi:rhomboid protease GluP
MYKPPDHGGSLEKAHLLFFKTIELDPNFHEGYYWLARIYYQDLFQQKDIEKANEYLNKALHLSPDDYFYNQGLTADVQIPDYEKVKEGLRQ